MSTPAQAVETMTPGTMIVEPDPQYGWHVRYGRSNGKPKNAYYSQPLMAILVRRTLTLMGESMSPDERQAFLDEIGKLMTPARETRKAARAAKAGSPKTQTVDA